MNLCTPDRTYFLRQVQSSNSIFLTRPSERSSTTPTPTPTQQSGDGIDEDKNGGKKYNVLTAAGLCKSTLEVQDIRDPELKVSEAMRRMLHVYDRVDLEADADVDVDTMDVDDHGGKDDIKDKNEAVARFLADTPFSTAQCERAWVEMCGFVHEMKETGGLACWEATAQVKLAVWKRIVEGAVLEGIDLGKQFLSRDLWRAVEGGIAPFPKGLFDAVVRRLTESSAKGVYEDVKCEFVLLLLEAECKANLQLLGTNFDGEKVVSWTGRVYLEATAPLPSSRISQSKYLNGWRDLLPEGLRKEASMDRIKVRSNRMCHSHIMFTS